MGKQIAMVTAGLVAVIVLASLPKGTVSLVFAHAIMSFGGR